MHVYEVRSRKDNAALI